MLFAASFFVFSNLGPFVVCFCPDRYALNGSRDASEIEAQREHCGAGCG